MCLLYTVCCDHHVRRIHVWFCSLYCAIQLTYDKRKYVVWHNAVANLNYSLFNWKQPKSFLICYLSEKKQIKWKTIVQIYRKTNVERRLRVPTCIERTHEINFHCMLACVCVGLCTKYGSTHPCIFYSLSIPFGVSRKKIFYLRD